MHGGYFFKALSHWTDYKGRARRAEFWMYALVAWLIEVFLTAVTAVVVNPAYDSTAGTLHTYLMTPVGWIFLGATVVITVVLFFPFLALTVRRLHDLGLGGWWAVFLFFLSIVVLIMAMFDGQPHANRFGPDPKGRG